MISCSSSVMETSEESEASVPCSSTESDWEADQVRSFAPIPQQVHDTQESGEIKVVCIHSVHQQTG